MSWRGPFKRNLLYLGQRTAPALRARRVQKWSRKRHEVTDEDRLRRLVIHPDVSCGRRIFRQMQFEPHTARRNRLHTGAGDIEFDAIGDCADARAGLARGRIARRGIGVGRGDGFAQRHDAVRGDGIAGAGNGNRRQQSASLQLLDNRPHRAQQRGVNYGHFFRL